MSGDGGVLVVGAGVAGLSCARALTDAGRAVAVVDRARGVGGRCATRRVEGQAVDTGVAVLHGRDPAFTAVLESVPATCLSGWPVDVHGSGRPCQPEAFGPGERRLSYAEGVNAFPRHLASGLRVRTRAPVERLDLSGKRSRAVLEGGEALEAGTLVLALAPEEAQRLLGSVPEPPGQVASALAVLGTARSDAALALAALYPREAPRPPWQVSYPEDSSILQIVSHDSSKRTAPAFLALVCQAHPRWSREHAEEPLWPDLVLGELARLLGRWALAPVHRHPHRWRYARTDRSAELASPLLFPLPGGCRLGLCGDRFAPGGGVEAAWISGRALARRILAEEDA